MAGALSLHYSRGNKSTKLRIQKGERETKDTRTEEHQNMYNSLILLFENEMERSLLLQFPPGLLVCPYISFDDRGFAHFVQCCQTPFYIFPSISSMQCTRWLLLADFESCTASSSWVQLCPPVTEVGYGQILFQLLFSGPELHLLPNRSGIWTISHHVCVWLLPHIAKFADRVSLASSCNIPDVKKQLKLDHEHHQA